MEYKISLDEQNRILKTFETRTDAEAERIKRYLALPDLSRTPGNPLYEIMATIQQLPTFKNFDNIIIPEIVPTDILFDLFDFASFPAMAARSLSRQLRPVMAIVWAWCRKRNAPHPSRLKTRNPKLLGGVWSLGSADHEP